jgi:hypothetical protein
MKIPEYKMHKDHEAIKKSAYLAIKSILQLDLYPMHKRELIDTCIWKITEVDGKYRTRYRSEAALNIKKAKELHHEHVIERKYLIDQILANPADFYSSLDRAVGCVVTRKEHSLLSLLSKQNPTLNGWERYKVAKIKVFDLLTGREVSF